MIVKELKILFAYLRSHWKVLLLFALLLGTMFMVYGLYALPWGPVIYTSILLIAAAILFGALSFRVYRKRIVQLEILKKQASRHLGELPEPSGLLERRYQEIVKLVEARSLNVEETARQNAADTTRYYTLWSHQIKTPLAAIRLLLQEKTLDYRALEQELLKTEQYVEMVLQYQRLNTDKRDLVLQQYALDALVKQALKRVSTLFIHKRISVRLEPIDAAVITDEKWLTFVIEQLLTNAVKYTPPEGTVTIRLGPDAAQTLIIEDTGIGIRPEDLPRVFEWGYTGYNGRLDKRSTGIGLSLCRQVMALLGHGIAITSAVGRGTTVTLDLSRERFDVE